MNKLIVTVLLTVAIAFLISTVRVGIPGVQGRVGKLSFLQESNWAQCQIEFEEFRQNVESLQGAAGNLKVYDSYRHLSNVNDGFEKILAACMGQIMGEKA